MDRTARKSVHLKFQRVLQQVSNIFTSFFLINSQKYVSVKGFSIFFVLFKMGKDLFDEPDTTALSIKVPSRSCTTVSLHHSSAVPYRPR